MIVQPVVLELGMAEIAAPMDGTDDLELPGFLHRRCRARLLGHQVLVGEDLRGNQAQVDEGLRVLAHRRGRRPRKRRPGIFQAAEVERHHAVERRNRSAEGDLAGGEARHDFLQRGRVDCATLVPGVLSQPVVLELGERQVRSPLHQAHDLDHGGILHHRSPVSSNYLSAAAARRRTAFSQKNSAMARPIPAALIHRPAPNAPAGVKMTIPVMP